MLGEVELPSVYVGEDRWNDASSGLFLRGLPVYPRIRSSREGSWKRSEGTPEGVLVHRV